MISESQVQDKDKRSGSMIFETHAHYEDEQFDSDRDELLAFMPQQGISPVVNVGSTIETTKKSILLAESYDFIYAAVGVHPSEIDCLNEENLEWLRARTEHPKVAAVGEIGLDYYWDKEEEVRQRQRYWFMRQIELAADTGLPVIIHSRDAAADTFEIMKKAHDMHVSGVIHCFSYSAEMARQYVDLGYYIGVGGVVTFKNAKKLREVVETIPLSSILLETDCPYMAPEPYRGKRNQSMYLTYVAEKIAQIKGVAVEAVIEAASENAYRLYRIRENQPMGKAGAAVGYGREIESVSQAD